MGPAAVSKPAPAGRTRVLAVASGGGHWVQLLRLRPAFGGCDVTFVTVRDSYRCQVPGQAFIAVNDATRWNKFSLLLLAFRIFRIVAVLRPNVVVSTGAAPGYFALRFGRWFGARTLWIDSIANVEEVSLSGRRIASHVDAALTQWKHLEGTAGFRHRGAVL
jgi:UDP-N-acetylglucosamine:LPS N-acetylglucosamine transferase